MNIIEICLRIALAMMIGGVIGWERETSNRPAGLRTHMLVAIGAAVVMMMGEMALAKYSGITSMDPTRLGAQVISGIGFLGAGTIMREGLSVRGLTTAASLWAVACLGLAAGGGFYEAAIIGSIAIILTLTIFEYLENHFRKRARVQGLRIEMDCKEISSTLNGLKRIAPNYDIVISDIDITDKIGEDGNPICHLISDLSLSKCGKKIDRDGFIVEISMLEGVSKVKVKEI